VECATRPRLYVTAVVNGVCAGKPRHYPGVPQAFAAMKAGEVDAVMAMRGEIDWQVHEAADPQLALAENAYPNMGKQLWEIGMAVHESNRQLAYAVEEALESLIREGSVKTIYGQYGLRYDVPEMYQ